MRPEGLTAKVFLDSGDPEETKEIIDILGFLDGQTTNPTLISRNPQIKKMIEENGKFSRRKLLGIYEEKAREISELIPDGSVSIEVYADRHTKMSSMLEQAFEMYEWIDNAHIKLPATTAGIEAAIEMAKKKMKINMTLCFTQGQGVVVYAATKCAKNGDIYLSPFIGRLDDIGYRGMDLVQNLKRMYNKVNSHVLVLAASIRNVRDLKEALSIADIATVPFKVLKEWGKLGMPLDVEADERDLKLISYDEIDPGEFGSCFYPFFHALIGKGLQGFADDWNSLLVDSEKYSRR